MKKVELFFLVFVLILSFIGRPDVIGDHDNGFFLAPKSVSEILLPPKVHQYIEALLVEKRELKLLPASQSQNRLTEIELDLILLTGPDPETLSNEELKKRIKIWFKLWLKKEKSIVQKGFLIRYFGINGGIELSEDFSISRYNDLLERLISVKWLLVDQRESNLTERSFLFAQVLAEIGLEGNQETIREAARNFIQKYRPRAFLIGPITVARDEEYEVANQLLETLEKSKRAASNLYVLMGIEVDLDELDFFEFAHQINSWMTYQGMLKKEDSLLDLRLKLEGLFEKEKINLEPSIPELLSLIRDVLPLITDMDPGDRAWIISDIAEILVKVDPDQAAPIYSQLIDEIQYRPHMINGMEEFDRLKTIRVIIEILAKTDIDQTAPIYSQLSNMIENILPYISEKNIRIFVKILENMDMDSDQTALIYSKFSDIIQFRPSGDPFVQAEAIMSIAEALEKMDPDQSALFSTQIVNMVSRLLSRLEEDWPPISAKKKAKTIKAVSETLANMDSDQAAPLFARLTQVILNLLPVLEKETTYHKAESIRAVVEALANMDPDQAAPLFALLAQMIEELLSPIANIKDPMLKAKAIRDIATALEKVDFQQKTALLSELTELIKNLIPLIAKEKIWQSDKRSAINSTVIALANMDPDQAAPLFSSLIPLIAGIEEPLFRAEAIRNTVMVLDKIDLKEITFLFLKLNEMNQALIPIVIDMDTPRVKTKTIRYMVETFSSVRKRNLELSQNFENSLNEIYLHANVLGKTSYFYASYFWAVSKGKTLNDSTWRKWDTAVGTEVKHLLDDLLGLLDHLKYAKKYENEFKQLVREIKSKQPSLTQRELLYEIMVQLEGLSLDARILFLESYVATIFTYSESSSIELNRSQMQTELSLNLITYLIESFPRNEVVINRILSIFINYLEENNDSDLAKKVGHFLTSLELHLYQNNLIERLKEKMTDPPESLDRIRSHLIKAAINQAKAANQPTKERLLFQFFEDRPSLRLPLSENIFSISL